MAELDEVHYRVLPGGVLSGRLQVPGDKSISHRAIMLAALAEGESRITGFLEGADALATIAAFQALGVSIVRPAAGEVQVRGVGLHGLRAPAGPLDMGNSGTAMRLLSGLLSGQDFATTLLGDASLSKRPMRRVTEPLGRMGAHITAGADGTPPLSITPVGVLRGIDYPLPVASAQVKSALLLAGLYARGTTCVTEPAPTRDHTERMLGSFGYPIGPAGLQCGDGRVCLEGGGRLRGCVFAVPGDLSSAAFFMVGASIAPGSDLVLEGVGINPTRVGVINILRAMGARIDLLDVRGAGAEPVADIRVRAASLRGIHIPPEQVPLAIDEFPALFIAAACAEGETVLRGAAELRVKESDRIQVMANGLARLGVAVEVLEDGIRIRGGGFTGSGACTIDSHGDHRVAMAFAIAALRAGETIEIADCRNVATSFPGFVPLAHAAGLQIEEQHP